MPPKKGVKRPAPKEEEIVVEKSKPAKQSKKVKENVEEKVVVVAAPAASKKKTGLIEKPDLRNVLTGGVVLAVGQSDVGQLGLGEDVLEKTRFAVIPNYTDIVAIAAGGMHNVCLTKTGNVITFGCNDEGALGRDTSKEEGSETIPGPVKLDGKAIQITAGDSHSAALLEDGRVFAWGSFRDSHGTMGLTPKGNERLPIELLSTIKIIKISSGADHLVMLSENGHVYTCGCGEQGQLGRVASRTADRHNRHGIDHLLNPNLVEFKINKKLQFSNIWAGQYCTFAREYNKGDIYVFGLNNYHQIGLSDPIAYYHPKISKTFNGKDWNVISSGQHHTIALDNDGQVFVLGRKEYGRLGLGKDCSDVTELTRVEIDKQKINDVAAGSAQSFAVTESGQLFAWGMGSSGSLGTGEEDDVDTPVLIKGKQLEGKTVVRVVGGGQHTIILAQTTTAATTPTTKTKKDDKK
ncbi:regulator of chromosome condensation-like [Aphidius gifuensis]|uniref:regulator of chromosome condensation-like n=1 Tax=Aphidius gifuensis TaxID=684658 RepID=UPI001CDBF5FC|nr:regulator of chromosome condensation-like [Aphidius gifuensis]